MVGLLGLEEGAKGTGRVLLWILELQVIFFAGAEASFSRELETLIQLSPMGFSHALIALKNQIG